MAVSATKSTKEQKYIFEMHGKTYKFPCVVKYQYHFCRK